jgi:hypothetical protein
VAPEEEIDEAVPVEAIEAIEPAPIAADVTAIPDLRGMGLARALDVAREAGIVIEVVGSGVAVRQDGLTVTFAPNQLSSGMEIGESARSSRR